MKRLIPKKTDFALMAGLAVFSAIVIIVLGTLFFAPPPAPVFGRGTVTVEGAEGKKAIFSVETASTPEQQAYGLMFRRRLARDAGMLFLFKPATPVSFWMRNTLIPLDMIFAREDGTIAKIAAKAVPRDETKILSGEPIAYVLEIYGGEAERWGIREGDALVYSGSWPEESMNSLQDR